VFVALFKRSGGHTKKPAIGLIKPMVGFDPRNPTILSCLLTRPRFSANWQYLRKKQLLQEDIRQWSQIQEIR